MKSVQAGKQGSELAIDQTTLAVETLLLGVTIKLTLDADAAMMMRTNDVLVEAIVNEIGTW